MKILKLVIIIQLIIGAGLLFPSSDTKAAMSYDYQFSDVALDRTWNITFNQSLDPSSIIGKNIHLFKENGTQFPIELFYTDETKTIKVKPVGTYDLDSSYILSVEEGVKSKNNKSLNNKVQMQFSTVKASDLILEGITSGESYIVELEKEIERLKNYSITLKNFLYSVIICSSDFP